MSAPRTLYADLADGLVILGLGVIILGLVAVNLLAWLFGALVLAPAEALAAALAGDVTGRRG